MAFFNFLDFPLTSALQTEHAAYIAAKPCNFNAGNLRVFVPLDRYQPLKSPPDSRLDGFASTQVIVTQKIYGFEAEPLAADDTIAEILESLITNARAITGQYAGVTVHDYHWVEKADKTAGYTARSGIMEIERISGSIRKGAAVNSDRLNLGFRIRFEEINRRV